MFAIAFDLTVKEVTKHHPKRVAAAYADIGVTLAGFEFRWVQGTVSMFVKMRIWGLNHKPPKFPSSDPSARNGSVTYTQIVHTTKIMEITYDPTKNTCNIQGAPSENEIYNPLSSKMERGYGKTPLANTRL